MLINHPCLETVKEDRGGKCQKKTCYPYAWVPAQAFHDARKKMKDAK